MSTCVMIDGESVAESEATISIFDRGFLYGDSVFETIRTYDGVPFALDEHLKRLERSAALVFIPLPVPLSQLREEVLAAVRTAANSESYIRVMVTRGQAAQMGLSPDLADVPRRIIIVMPLEPPSESAYRNGITVVSFRTQRVTDATGAEGAKIGNYLVSVLAMREARKIGAAEAIIVDARGRVVEGASSNVFMVQRGRLITPPVEAGILPGITRARVLQAAQDLSIAVDLRAPKYADLLKADEVFVSSSIRELLPVVRIDSKQIAEGKPGPITRALHQRFEQLRQQSAVSPVSGP